MATINAINNSSAPFTVTSGDLTASGTYSKAVGATAQALLVDSTGLIGGLAGAANTIFVGGTKPSFTATPQCTDLTLTGILKLPATSSSSAGVITAPAASGTYYSFLHQYGNSGSTNGYNIFLGLNAGNFTLTTGTSRFNIGIGDGDVINNKGTLHALTTGKGNSAFGYSSLSECTSGSGNVSFGGINVLRLLTTGNGNFAAGYVALDQLTTGSYNICIGSSDPSTYTSGAGHNYTSSESSNILISNTGTVGESNTIRIGTQGSSDREQDTTYIAGIYNTAVGATAGVVLSDSSHQLGGLAGSAGTVLVGGTKPAFTATPSVTSISFDAGTTNLSKYSYSTWVPAVTFNGGSTGVTYSSRGGTYWRIGSVVYFTFFVTLTSKGSATGQLRITGLPFTPSEGSYCTALLANVTFVGTQIVGNVSSSNYILFSFSGNSSEDISTIANTHCDNDLKIRSSGFYFV